MRDDYFYYTTEYRELQAEKTRLAWKKGLHDAKISPLEERKCKRDDCSSTFKVKPYYKKNFCSQSCSAIYNNIHRGFFSDEWRKKISLSLIGKPNKFKGKIKVARLEKNCLTCNKKFLTERWKNKKYCSVNCLMRDVGSRPTSPKAARAKAGIRPDIDSSIYFFSRWEANFARLLNLLNIKWIFQPKTFKLKTQRYMPDFYLPEYDTYIEIKNFLAPYSLNRDQEFRLIYPNLLLALVLKKDYLELQDGF